MSDSVQPHRRQLTRLRRPWDSPGKDTGVSCHLLLQCVKVKLLSYFCQNSYWLNKRVHPFDGIVGKHLTRLFEGKCMSEEQAVLTIIKAGSKVGMEPACFESFLCFRLSGVSIYMDYYF